MIHTCQRRGPDEAHSACWRTSAAGARGHDAVGRRVETVEYWDAQAGPLDLPRHTRHVYDGLQAVEDYMCEAATCGWSLAREFLWGGRFPEPIAMIDHTAAGLLPANQPEVLHYLHDVLGSVIGLTNSAGTLVERYTYDPYGKTLVERRDPLTGSYELNGADGNFPTWSAFGNPFMWTAQRYDATVGLYHFKYRTYNPIWGRWNQQDPLEYADSLNLYEYVLSAPVNWTDPWGLTIYFVYIQGGGPNPFGHALAKHVDKDGNVTYYDINNHGDGTKGHKYTESEFQDKYKDREDKEAVEVEVKDEDKTVKYYEDQVGKSWDYNAKSHNCVTFVCTGIRKGGGHVYDDGSRGENPNRYPRDARDGYKQRNKDKDEGTDKAKDRCGDHK